MPSQKLILTFFSMGGWGMRSSTLRARKRVRAAKKRNVNGITYLNTAMSAHSSRQNPMKTGMRASTMFQIKWESLIGKVLTHILSFGSGLMF